MFISTGTGNSSWGQARSSFAPMSKRVAADPPPVEEESETECDCENCHEFWESIHEKVIKYEKSGKCTQADVDMSVGDIVEVIPESPGSQPIGGFTKDSTTGNVSWGPLRRMGSKERTPSKGTAKKSSK